MEYQVELSDIAEAELDAAYLSLTQKSLDSAWRWYLGAKAAADTLSMFPRRSPAKMIISQIKKSGNYFTEKAATLTGFSSLFLTKTQQFGLSGSGTEHKAGGSRRTNRLYNHF